MTLEKLLIFGFGLAVLVAITTIGTNMMTEREKSGTKFSDDIKTLEGMGG